MRVMNKVWHAKFLTRLPFIAGFTRSSAVAIGALLHAQQTKTVQRILLGQQESKQRCCLFLQVSLAIAWHTDLAIHQGCH
jgi:hypothetical protein